MREVLWPFLSSRWWDKLRLVSLLSECEAGLFMGVPQLLYLCLASQSMLDYPTKIHGCCDNALMLGEW